MIKCSHCGAELPDGEVLCPKCGNEIQLVPNYETLDLNMMVVQKNLDELETKHLEEQRAERKRVLRNRKILKLLAAVVIVTIAAIGIAVAVMTIRSTMASDQDFNVIYAHAAEAYESGEYDEAYKLISDALNVDKSSIQGKLLKAKTTYKLGNTDEATELLNEIISSDPTSEEAYEQLINIYCEQQMYNELYDLMSNASDKNIKTKFAEYYVNRPLFSIDEGTYNEEMDLTLSSANNYEIRYTIDGTDPTSESMLYESPIHIGIGTVEIKAVAISSLGVLSPIESKSFIINPEAPSSPQIQTASGTYYGSDSEIKVNIPDGCSAYYAFDKKPTIEDGTLVNGKITMQEGKHFFYIFVINDKGIQSSIAAAVYEYAVSAPTAEPTAAPQNNSNTDNSNNTYNYNNNNNYSNNNYNNNGGYSGGGENNNYYEPTAEPTAEPTVEPTIEPTVEPTVEPTIEPTVEPTPEPTAEPTIEVQSEASE